MVKRYELEDGGAEMREDEDGTFILHSDYRTLERALETHTRKDSKGFICYHAPTGAMDGVYFDTQEAHHMVRHWAEEVQVGQWLLLEIVVLEGERSPVIPEDRFAANVFGGQRIRR